MANRCVLILPLALKSATVSANMRDGGPTIAHMTTCTRCNSIELNETNLHKGAWALHGWSRPTKVYTPTSLVARAVQKTEVYFFGKDLYPWRQPVAYRAQPTTCAEHSRQQPTENPRMHRLTLHRVSTLLFSHNPSVLICPAPPCMSVAWTAQVPKPRIGLLLGNSCTSCPYAEPQDIVAMGKSDKVFGFGLNFLLLYIANSFPVTTRLEKNQF